ncbi:hypothetical protein J6590_092300 [Homalodisca vitripennis]|nr:hypothetical protein J6590_092300 [Homalodisca vitripennis]
MRRRNRNDKAVPLVSRVLLFMTFSATSRQTSKLSQRQGGYYERGVLKKVDRHNRTFGAFKEELQIRDPRRVWARVAFTDIPGKKRGTR